MVGEKHDAAWTMWDASRKVRVSPITKGNVAPDFYVPHNTLPECITDHKHPRMDFHSYDQLKNIMHSDKRGMHYAKQWPQREIQHGPLHILQMTFYSTFLSAKI